MFSVKDNGIGLSPRDTKRIFKRFFQVDQRLSRSGGGCGLGLSIVKFIVTAHHGNVRVESQPGRGQHVYHFIARGGEPAPGSQAELSHQHTERLSGGFEMTARKSIDSWKIIAALLRGAEG